VLAGAFAVVAATGIGVEASRRPAHTLQFQTHGSGPVSIGTSATGSRPSSSTTVAPRGRVSGLPLADTSWVSDDEGWALVKSALLHTTDGGVTWTKVSTPPATVILPTDGEAPSGVDCTKDACVSHVRYADPQHGWLFGASQLVTNDGGATWSPERSRPVVALEVAHGRAFRVVTATDGCPPACSYAVETATVGSSAWTRLATPAIDGDAAQLLYDGPRLSVAVYGNPAGGAPAQIKLLRSLDAGRTWQLLTDPCDVSATEEIDTASLAAAPGGFLVALCQPRLHDRPISVTMSTNAGTTFGPPRALPLPPGAVGEAVAAGAPGSIAVAALDGSRQQVLVSRDQGASWITTLTAVSDNGVAGVGFLGFEDVNTARVAFTGDRLWTTRDAGTTWSLGRP
jgi:photosystem II stability/assembly factor-like uncharacterized protein